MSKNLSQIFWGVVFSSKALASVAVPYSSVPLKIYVIFIINDYLIFILYHVEKRGMYLIKRVL